MLVPVMSWSFVSTTSPPRDLNVNVCDRTCVAGLALALQAKILGFGSIGYPLGYPWLSILYPPYPQQSVVLCFIDIRVRAR